jgi:hypothetical protein
MVEGGRGAVTPTHILTRKPMGRSEAGIPGRKPGMMALTT